MSERQQRGAEDLAFLLKPYLPKSWPEGQDWVGSHAGICSVTAVLGTGSESTVGEHSCRLSSHKGRGDGGGKVRRNEGKEQRRQVSVERQHLNGSRAGSETQLGRALFCLPDSMSPSFPLALALPL